MFGGDDDDDFAPGASSKLASLFGFGKAVDESYASLTYTAPKQPKKNRPESQGSQGSTQSSTQSPAQPPKLSIIIVKAVHTYKLEDGNYNGQGKLGAAILGNVTAKIYQLLLYKGKQQHVTSSRIIPSFQFLVQPNNYATFYDDQKQNWSIMFESNEDALEFSKEIGLARVTMMGEQEHTLISQELLSGMGTGATAGDSVEFHYTVYSFAVGKMDQEVESTKTDTPQRVKLKTGSWEEGLIGVTKGCKRLIAVPSSMSNPWKPKVPKDATIILIVEILRIKTVKKSREGAPSGLPSLGDSGESAFDSSTDDTSIKARGASISEALSNSPKTHKASIISRVARMGQATLPLKGAIPCNPSDSEESEEESSGTMGISSKGNPPKSRLSKSRVMSEKPVAPTLQQQQQQTLTTASNILPQQLTLYQAVPWQQPQPQQQFLQPRTNGSVPYSVQPQLYPMVPQQQLFQGPITTPTTIPSPESHLSLLLAETRTQNSELRMGVTKVADRVDQVLTKLDSLHHHHLAVGSGSVGGMDPVALLTSIQKLVTDNEQLHKELEEKRTKIDQQNEKIYQLLHSNQKFLEQSSNMIDKRQQESPLQELITVLQLEKEKLNTDLKEAEAQTSTLQKQVIDSQETYSKLNEELSAIAKQLETHQSEAQRSKLLLEDKDSKISMLEEKLKSTSVSEESNNSLVESLRKEVGELEKKLSDFSKQMETDAEGRIKDIQNAHEDELEKLKEKVKELEQASHSSEDVKLREEEKNQIVQKTAMKYREAIKSLEMENTALQDRLKSFTSNSSPGVMDEVKKVMNLVYRKLQQQFVPGTSYDGANIRQVLMGTIRDVTLEYMEQKSLAPTHESKAQTKPLVEQKANLAQGTNGSGIPAETKTQTNSLPVLKEEERPSLKEKAEVENKSEPPTQPEAVEPSKEQMKDAKEEKIEERGKLTSDDVKSVSTDKEKSNNKNTSATTEKNESAEKTKETTLENGQTKESIESSSTQESSKGKESRESSLERSWRPQPPPPPLFDDDDDDDAWLS